MPIPLYLDTDPGIDDALALAYLLNSPEIELVGIGTVSGNIDSVTGARNALDLLHLAGHPEIPVAVGAYDPEVGAYRGGAPHVHGRNGIGNVTLEPSSLDPIPESAAEMIIALSHRYAGTLRILAIGPLTNLAVALDLDPTLPGRIDDVIVMGGAVLRAGNVTAVSEANIHNDPEAAAAVFAASWHITLAPLDLTMQHTLGDAERAELGAASSAMLRSVADMLDYYLDFYAGVFGERRCALHDPLAAALACGTIEVTSGPTVPVTVDVSDGPDRGRTICDLPEGPDGYADVPGGNTRVVLDIAEPFAPHLLDRLLDESDREPAAPA